MPETSKLSTMFLPVKLTEAEKEDFKKRLLDCLDEADTIEGEKKASNDAFKHRLSENASNTDYWRRCLKEGAEHRQVEVRLESNLAENKVITYRADTWDQVNFRAMTPNERADLEQTRLPLDDEPETGPDHTDLLESLAELSQLQDEADSLTDEQRAENLVAGIEDVPSETVSAEWIPLDGSYRDCGILLETGFMGDDGEVQPKGNGYLNPDTSEAWLNPDGSKTNFKKSKWAITHYRAIQPESN